MSEHGNARSRAAQEQREQIAFQAAAKEGDEFYKMVVTVATAFLGGSLLFFEKFAPNPLPFVVIVAGLGWASLIVCICLVIRVRQFNMLVFRQSLSGEDCSDADEKSVSSMKWSIRTLAFGLSLVVASGVISMLQRSKGTNMAEQVRIEQKSLPISQFLQSQSQSSSSETTQSKGESTQAQEKK